MNKKSNGYGIASMVLGIISILFSWIIFVSFISAICGLLSIIFYSMQRKVYPNTIATSGLVTGIIGLVLSTFWTILYLIAWIGGVYTTTPMM